jgi:hypothetical protein
VGSKGWLPNPDSTYTPSPSEAKPPVAGDRDWLARLTAEAQRSVARVTHRATRLLPAQRFPKLLELEPGGVLFESRPGESERWRDLPERGGVVEVVLLLIGGFHRNHLGIVFCRGPLG